LAQAKMVRGVWRRVTMTDRSGDAGAEENPRSSFIS
jgi:hypothetical protein